MDVNRTPWLLLADAAAFAAAEDALAWDAGAGCLRLREAAVPRWPVRARDAGYAARAASPLRVLDGHGLLGVADEVRIEVILADGRHLAVRDADGQPLEIAAGARFTALGLGGDDRLAASWSDAAAADPAQRHGLFVLHLRRRWCERLPLDFAVDALHVDADGAIWLAGGGQLARVAGAPLPQPFTPLAGFRPLADNPQPLRLHERTPHPNGEALALCGDADTLYLLLGHADAAQEICTRPRSVQAPVWRVHQIAADSPLPWAGDLLPSGRGSLLLACAPQADDTAFARCDIAEVGLRFDELNGVGAVEAIAVRWPQMARPLSARSVVSADGRPRYLAADGPRVWLPLPQREYARAGTATLLVPLDSRQAGACWHRIYLDACIPPGCSLRLAARAADTLAELAQAEFLDQPAPSWNPLPSELGFFPGLLAQRAGESGLFELLLQRPSGNLRRLDGRFLQLQLHFAGDGRRTPQLHALRVYAPRFDYQEHYLPELFRQQEAARDADEPANGADLRERLLAVCEGLLTPLEGRIAAAEALLDPQAAPAAFLPWLASFLGRTPLADWPEARVRRWLAHLGELLAWRGTLRGVALALDLATDGAVGRGEIVPVENFRLRRSMATLLGLLPDSDAHPLTLGTTRSGNSIVGDSLILSESDTRAFLALFAPEQAQADERAAVQTFFLHYAHRISVLLHGPGRAWSTVVARVLEEELPAHLAWDLYPSEYPFVPGLSPLLAYDTFLEPTPAPAGVRLGTTRLGREGLLRDAPALVPLAADAGEAAP